MASKLMFAVIGPSMLPNSAKNHAGPSILGDGGICVPPDGAGAGVAGGAAGGATGGVAPPPPAPPLPENTGAGALGDVGDAESLQAVAKTSPSTGSTAYRLEVTRIETSRL